MLIMPYGLLTCCSSLPNVILTTMAGGKNLSYHEPKIMEGQLDERNGLELPYYTAGFE